MSLHSTCWFSTLLLLVVSGCDRSYADSINCRTFDRSEALEQMPNKSYFDSESPAPEELHFDFDIVEYGPDGRSVTTISEKPVVGVRLHNGWLLGSDHGEWGGLLLYKAGRSEQTLVEDNIEDIYEFSSGYVAVAGLSHMTLSRGSIYFIKGEEPEFIVEVLFGLPAAPRSSWLIAPNELLINVEGDLSYVLRDDGTLEKVTCN